jgi:GGDEF domain-containing protein
MQIYHCDKISLRQTLACGRLDHETDDDAPQRIGRVLIAFVRPDDTVCGWGGEEFVIVLTPARSAVFAGQMMRETANRMATPPCGPYGWRKCWPVHCQ